MRHLIVSSVLLMSASLVLAETDGKLAMVSPVHTPVPAARISDVSSVDGIIAALYDVISGGVGEKRDWQRLRSLFIPEARLQAIMPKKEGGFALRLLSVSDYIANSGPVLMESGFRERELARRVEQWGEFTQIWSAYEGLMEKSQDRVRGINGIQLMFDGQRWWVVSLLFEAERGDLKLSAAFPELKSDAKK